MCGLMQALWYLKLIVHAQKATDNLDRNGYAFFLYVLHDRFVFLCPRSYQGPSHELGIRRGICLTALSSNEWIRIDVVTFRWAGSFWRV
jgi:hypothetical protein